MIYAVEVESRLLYEVRPMGDFIMIRPAAVGKEHLLERIDFIQFNRMFDAWLGQFLIPEQLREEDYEENISY
jgi:hypothetical protein